MQYYLTLLFLFGIQICMAATYLPDTIAIPEDYFALARQYEEEGISDKAIHYYELAKSGYSEAQNDVFLVYALNRLASLYKSDGSKWDRAQNYLDTANTILDEKLYENDTLRALTWFTMAELNTSMRNHDKALEYFQKSLVRRRAVYGENHLAVAEVLEEIGSIYLYDLQNPYESERYHEQALKIREELNDTSRQLTNCFYHLAYANRLQGDFEKAFAYGFRVLQAYKKAKNSKFYIYNIVAANSLLGSISYGLGRYDDALQYNSKAIELSKSSQSFDLSLHYNNQAEYHFQKEQYDSTIFYARLAIVHQSQNDLLASSYQFLGNANTKKNQMKDAFKHLQKSLALKKNLYVGNHTQLATLYIDLGKSFEADSQVDSALYYYQKGLNSARISEHDTSKNISLSIQTGDDLASIQEALKHITSVLIKQYNSTHDLAYLLQTHKYFQLFDRFMDLSRSDYTTEGAKLILSGDHKSTYEKAISSTYRLYKLTQADSLPPLIFHYMEKSKAMVLLESILQSEKNLKILPDSILQQIQSLKVQLAFYQSELVEAKNQGDEPSTISGLQLKKANIIRKTEALNHHIEINYANYYKLTSRDLTVPLDSIQGDLAENQSIVSYFWGDSAVYALHIEPDDIETHKIDNISGLTEAIQEYQNVLAHDVIYDPSYQNYLKFQQNAYVLYQLLLAPILKNKNTEHLTIVADGNLTSIPFESLITSQVKTKVNDIRYEKLPYLIKELGISYEFSLSIAYWERRNRKSWASQDELNVVAFGIKNFDGFPQDRHYATLAGAEEEVQYIQQKFSSANVFLNSGATEAQFKHEAKRADILHIATHGIVDIKNPFTSKFIFYPDEKEDGTFHLYELYNTPLKAELLLLSACESGIGKHYIGEGNYSLARSFVYAGCKSVMMSLWQVNDIITKKLVVGFYDHLAAGASTSDALRKTKIELIEKGVYAHPQCWAGMLLLGNSEVELPVQDHISFAVISILISGIGIIILFLIVYRLILRVSIKAKASY